ncbi:MAG: adenosylmethionine--8-amino-7-oxononanoate transaminase [Myxococcaceae bacterium]
MDSSSRHERLLRLDQAHVWHPFTQMQGWPSDEPLIIERAEGNYLIDDLGRRYLDGVSSLWCNVHGHRKREIDDAVRSQLERVAHTTLLGLASVPSIELAAELVRLAPPGLSRVFFSDSGSTSVEVALKMAYQCWRQRGRPEKARFAALQEAYHGDTVGSVSVGGMELFHGTFRGLLFGAERIPTPYAYRWSGPGDCGAACLAAAERLFIEKGQELAALVVEPLVQGAAGMLTQPKGFLRRLAELCREHEVLLICDEVATGFGRTGTLFAVEQEEVVPDFLCLAKGLSGGYLPLAATLTTEKVHEAFLGDAASQRTFFHGHTFTGNPLACAAALASLRLFETEHVLRRLQGTLAALAPKLARVAELSHVGEVRQRGAMVGIELVKDRRTKESYSAAERIGHRVCLAARKQGVLLRPLGAVVVLLPPLSLTEEEARLLGDAVHHAITEVTGR